VTEEFIASIAVRVARDVAHVKDWKVSLTDASSSPFLQEVGQRRFSNAIGLEHHGSRRLLIVFFQGEDICEQTREGLDQLQDVIVETELRAWPPCPIHGHVLVPELTSDELYWICPEDGELRMKVGSL